MLGAVQLRDALAAAKAEARAEQRAADIAALRDEVAFWTFMETHPFGDDMIKVADNPNRVSADYLEATGG